MAVSGSNWLAGMALGTALSTTTVATAHATPNYALGRCDVADRLIVGTDTPGTKIRPTYDADSYILKYQSQSSSSLKKYIADQYTFDHATITTMLVPKHGKLIWDPSTGPNISATESGWYYYVSNKGYSGEDTFVMQVEKYGLKIDIHYTIEVPASDENPNGLCQLGEDWKISRIDVVNADGVQLASTAFTPANSFQPTFLISGVAELHGANIDFSDLAGLAVGQESMADTGASIILDTNVAGYGWFTDATPDDNSEFLPTSNPNEWIAKVGSPAYGTMDMYTVLLHEYGHALGLDHSPDGNDFMAATLQPGMRHVLSEADLAEITQLAGLPAPDPGQPLPPLPYDLSLMALALRRKQAAGGMLAEAGSNNTLGTLAPHYDVVVNPTLANSDFNGTAGWTTSGDVTMASGSAVLSESTTSQTRINQVFTVGPNDKFLRFTVAGTALSNPGDLPEDAFEAALLDANTGASLLDPISLSHTDAFLNQQGDGQAFLSDAVRMIANADGSRTYVVDLSHIATGTAVNLSFDLLGFGEARSQVTIRDLHIGETGGSVNFRTGA